MKNKILAICILGNFLLVGMASAEFSPTMNNYNDKSISKDLKSSADKDIEFYFDFQAGSGFANTECQVMALNFYPRNENIPVKIHIDYRLPCYMFDGYKIEGSYYVTAQTQWADFYWHEEGEFEAHELGDDVDEKGICKDITIDESFSTSLHGSDNVIAKCYVSVSCYEWDGSKWVYQDTYSDYANDVNEITYPKNKPYINTPFLRFLENHPHLFPLLRQLLRL